MEYVPVCNLIQRDGLFTVRIHNLDLPFRLEMLSISYSVPLVVEDLL